jgi:hypothetical protein
MLDGLQAFMPLSMRSFLGSDGNKPERVEGCTRSLLTLRVCYETVNRKTEEECLGTGAMGLKLDSKYTNPSLSF